MSEKSEWVICRSEVCGKKSTEVKRQDRWAAWSSPEIDRLVWYREESGSGDKASFFMSKTGHCHWSCSQSILYWCFLVVSSLPSSSIWNLWSWRRDPLGFFTEAMGLSQKERLRSLIFDPEVSIDASCYMHEAHSKDNSRDNLWRQHCSCFSRVKSSIVGLPQWKNRTWPIIVTSSCSLCQTGARDLKTPPIPISVKKLCVWQKSWVWCRLCSPEVSVTHSEGHVPPLQQVPSLTCSVTSLSRSPGH